MTRFRVYDGIGPFLAAASKWRNFRAVASRESAFLTTAYAPMMPFLESASCRRLSSSAETDTSMAFGGLILITDSIVATPVLSLGCC